MLLLHIAVFVLSVSGVVRGRCIEAVEADQLPPGITVHKVIRTWEEAQLHCKSEGAELASPLTTELLNAMRSVIGATNNTSYFIGTRASHSSGAYTSVEGVPLDNMTAAVMQMILELDPRDGDCLSMDLNSIRVVPCCVRRPFMCYTAPTANNDVTTEESEFQPTTEETEQRTSENKCAHSEGYTYFESTGSCYKVHISDERVWADASDVCQAEGGHLAVIDDSNEADVITQISSDEEQSYKYVGLHDYSGNGDWRSVTGKPLHMLYNEWNSGAPTGTPEYEFFCALLLPNGKIDDYGCNIHRPFICEI